MIELSRRVLLMGLHGDGSVATLRGPRRRPTHVTVLTMHMHMRLLYYHVSRVNRDAGCAYSRASVHLPTYFCCSKSGARIRRRRPAGPTPHGSRVSRSRGTRDTDSAQPHSSVLTGKSTLSRWYNLCCGR